jgi:putative DNA primase/helicase
MLAEALRYYKAGFAIIPLKPRAKTPLIKWARFQKRKPTEKEVTQWWTRWPQANIGLVAGTINRIIVFDQDGPDAEKMIKEKGGFPPGPQSATAKGRHYIFRHPGYSIRNDVNKNLSIDIRSDGGYVVAPPSVHPNGSIYEWVPSLSIFEVEIPVMREWQINYLKENCIIESAGEQKPPRWEKEALQGVLEGERNDVATRLAGRYVGKGLADEEVSALLHAWNRKNRPPLSKEELFAVIKSIRDKDSRKPKEGGGEPRSLFDRPDLPDSVDAATPSDFFEGRRFVPQYLSKYLEGKFRPIVFAQGDFYAYKASGAWKPLELDRLGQVAEQVLGKHTRSARVEDGIKTLQKRVYLGADEFKHDPGFLNLRNGMLKIATMELKPHSPQYLSRIQLNVEFSKDAEAPRWHQFLREIFPGAPEKAQALQSYLGYCLMPSCKHQRCLFMLGSGSNGKSVVNEVFTEIIGVENVCSLPLQLMGERFLVGVLRDKLVNVAFELGTSRPTDTSLFKAAVAGDLLMADQKHGKPFVFRPIAKHIFSMNESPKVTDKSYGFQRRPIVITFNERFEGERRDPDLAQKLIAEKDGIFAWILEGLFFVLEKDDLLIPKEIEDSTHEFVKSTNPVLLFVEDCCILGDKFKVRPRDLYMAYVEFCKEGHNRELSRNRFYDQLEIHYPQVRSQQVGTDRQRFFVGIGLRDESSRSP